MEISITTRFLIIAKKNNKAKVQEPVYSDDGETLVLLCSLLVPLFKKIFPATDIQKEVQ